MTQPFATAHVDAELNWGNLDEELATKVRAAALKASRAAQRELNRIKFTPNVDVSQLRRDIRMIEGLTARVNLDVSQAEIRRFVRDISVKLRDNRPVVHVNPVVDMARLRGQLRQLPDGKVKVGLYVTNAEVRRFATELRAMLSLANIQMPIGLDVRNEAAFIARINELTRDRTMNVRMNQSGGGGGLGGGGGGMGGRRSPVFRTLKIGGIATLVMAIAGAAGTALGAVGALAGGLAALGPAALAGAGTAVVGLNGIGDAFSAFSDQSASAGQDAKAQAKAIESAARGVEQAEKAVVRAKKDAKDAEDDLTRARKDALNQLEDLNLELRGAALSEKDAILSIREAQRDLATGKFDNPDERARAVLRVEEAEQRLLEVQARNKDLAEETYEANVKGVEGSDQVVDAKDRLAEANDNVKESQRDLIDAMNELAEAQSPAAGGVDKVAEALAKLSPNARDFVLAMRDLGPMWKDLRLATQDAMFADLDTVFTNLAQATLPTLKTGMVEVADAMNRGAQSFATFWSSAEAQEGLRAAFSGTATLIDSLQPGLEQLSTGFLDMARAAEPVMDKVGQGLGDLLGGIGQAFTDAFESGALTQLISTFGDIMSGLGGGLNSLLDGLIEMGNIVGPYIGPLFQAFGDAIKDMAPSLGVLGAAFTSSFTAMLPTLAEFISELADGLAPVMPVLAQLFNALAQALMPLIPPLSDIMVVVGTALADAITALAPAMGPLGESFASLITAIAPMLPMIAEVVSVMIQALAPALTKIFDALGPVIEQWLDGMKPVLEQLAPILADVAMQLGEAIADALIQLMPLLPTLIDSFSRIVLAIAPFIPQLVEIWADHLPMMIELFTWLVREVLPKVVTIFEFLAQNILPIVIDAIRWFADQFAAKITSVRNAFSDVKEFFRTTVDAIGGFFGGLADTVGSVWDAILNKIKDVVGNIGNIIKGAGDLLGKVPGMSDRARTISGVGQGLIDWANMTTTGGTGGTLKQATQISALQKQAIPRGYANGGLFHGKGGPTDDANLIRISDQEHLAYVTKAQAVSGTTLPLLDAINNGWVPSAEFLSAMVGAVPGFAGGGLVSAEQVSQFPRIAGLEGAPYVWGGIQWGDCSGAMSAIARYAAGLDPFGGRFATGTMGAELASMGAQPGLGPAGSLNFGWYNGGPYGGHTAGTLPDGTNVEMGGGRGDGQVGGPAAGADDPSFTDHAHFPPEFFVGGDRLPGQPAFSYQSPADAMAGGGYYTGGGGGGAGMVTGGGGVNLTGPSSAYYDPAMVQNATTGYSLPNTGGDLYGGYDPYSIGTGSWAERIDAANRWAADQNFGTQAEKWGYEAAGSIIGDLLSPLGLGGLAQDQVSNAYEEMMKQRAEFNSYNGGYGDNKLADTMIFQNHDERKATDEMERMLNNRTTPATVTTRNGG
ncbi:phage tail protein [Rhodococcoides kyotonense]|uniref:Tape measure protein n=1 Tax=Rhodococcoides kyotonense TaxID=398843 RepID=A0A239FN42_9NOCA|nr:hypothetical protein [Rhodococcus kyotonensis]SNS58038.1 hypothetical protein SAMN05421642_103370 [Rhodococcus kyotonensis]